MKQARDRGLRWPCFLGKVLRPPQEPLRGNRVFISLEKGERHSSVSKCTTLWDPGRKL